MGINIYCTQCEALQDEKQCFSSKRDLMDALRRYLVKNKDTHEIELKYINWFYREEDDDKYRVLNITEEERKEAKRLLNEKNLDGMFFWMCLDEDSHIHYTQARDFFKTFQIVKSFMTERFLDSNILYHAASKKHNLKCC